jgi:hypothetical protein
LLLGFILLAFVVVEIGDLLLSSVSVSVLFVPLEQLRQRQPPETLGQLAERAKAGLEGVSLQALDRVDV